MLKDITLGQYFPGDTAVHRLDPRTKILLVLVYIILIFSVNSFAGSAVLAAYPNFQDSSKVCIKGTEADSGFYHHYGSL